MSKARIFGHSLLWVFTTSLVVLAVLIVIARFLFTQVPSYKEDLEHYLSEEIGGQVHIGQLAARMDGFSPQLSLKNVLIDELNQQTHTLNVGEIRLSMSPLAVISGTVRPNKITIVETGISIRRFNDGRISIVGFSDQNEDSSSGDFSWLLEDGLFEVINSRIVWIDDLRDEEDVRLKNAHIVFQNIDQEHRLRITANLPDKMGEHIELSLIVQGDVLSSTDWTADGYLKARQLNVSNALQRLDIDGFDAKQGLVDAEIWSQWHAAQLTGVKGRVQLGQTEVERHQAVLTLDSLSSEFEWNKLTHGWELKADQLFFESNGLSQNNGQFSVQYGQASEKDTLINVTADGINIQPAVQLIQQVKLLDQGDADFLAKLKPTGELGNMRFSMVSSEEDHNWAFCGQLKHFSNRSVDDVPTTSNISGRACANKLSGWAVLDSSQASVHFQSLFKGALSLDVLKGQLSWAKQADEWQVMAEAIEIKTPHIETVTRFSSRIPLGKQPVWLELATDFGQIDAVHVLKYLPVGIMGKATVKWLDSALKGGVATGGGLRLRGPLNEYPYRKNEGLFQVLFNTEQIRLHYADDWPLITQVAAEVEFKNEGMNISSKQGEIAGNSIKQVSVRLNDLEFDNYLWVSGEINDELSGLYDFFKQSPLKQRISGLLNHSEVMGRADLSLELKIALLDSLETSVKASANISDGTMVFPDIGESITSVNGQIVYNEKGLSASSINANLMGEPVRVDIATNKQSTVVSANGKIKTITLAKKFPSPFWKNIKGQTSGILAVDVPKGAMSSSGTATLSVESHLDGISINYPTPVGKQPQSKQKFKVTTVLGETPRRIDVTYADNVNGVFLFKDSKKSAPEIDKVGIHLGQSVAPTPQHEGVTLSGEIKTLDLTSWEKALNASTSEKSESLNLNYVDLSVAQLILPDDEYNDVAIKAIRQPAAWQGHIKHRVLEGEFLVPDAYKAGALIDLNLERLTLPALEKKDETKALISTKEIEPQKFPNLNVNAQQLIIGKAALGRLSMKLRQKTNGLMIQEMKVSSERDSFSATGAWEKSGTQSVTGITGQLKSKSLGSLLSDIGLFDELDDASSDMYFDLNWPGAPQSFSKNYLSGYATVKTDKGRILNVEPGLGRIFGLLGLDTLKRRMKLDFSDLVQTGLSFDKIKGRFIIVNGEARTNNLHIESPSSRLDIAGRVGLAKEDYDQLITVTPKSTESLPVAGAIAAGPVVGAAIYLVQKIAGKEVNKLTGYQYRVKGSWENPEIKQLSAPGGKVFGMMGDFLSPVFGMLGGDSTKAKQEELLAPVE